MSDFDAFYAACPRKESPAAAKREYWHIRRQGVTHERLMAGLARYQQNLPRERRYWKKPANWLIDGDYDNEYEDAVPPGPSMEDTWFAECAELHQGSCGGSLKHRTRMLIERQRGQAS